ncbi:5-dehydro-2-deoxygluconokinase [Pseudotabrizicola sp. L79]|uniref:5-dehydro-2-deoxygluconokinase n=1 Tax=Pseudotabrizicola sp. L79 TaxID=3118402 RepID=UPI002F943C69
MTQGADQGEMGLGPRLAAGPFVVLGRAGMDLYADPPGTRMEDARRFEAHLGGSAGNIAAALTRQGMQAALLTRVSDDAVGRFVLAELGRYGIDGRHVGTIGQGLRTSLAVVETRAEDCQSVIYRNGAADFALTCDDVAAVDFAGCAALVITGTALADAGSRQATMAALAEARAAGAVCVMDVDYRPYSWASSTEAQAANLAAAQACDIVVGNDVEFGLLAGDMAKGLGVARDLVARSASIAVYKMGEKGAVTVSKSQEFTTGIYRTQALKPTGAGDAFMGGFLASLARGDALRAAVLRGSAAAALVVSRVGCAPACPTIPELDAFLAARPEPI